MDAALAAYLDGRMPVAHERVTWPNGLTFDFAAVLIDAPPPEAFVVSVRAILERDGQVLAFDDFDDEGGTHVIPGGRREAGESFIETLEREPREETGCKLDGAPRHSSRRRARCRRRCAGARASGTRCATRSGDGLRESRAASRRSAAHRARSRSR